MDKKISNMKYNEMQKIAKQVGIKANMKFDRLRTALIEYYQQENKEKTEESEPIIDQEIDKEVKEENNKSNDETTEKKSVPKTRKKVKSKRTAKKKNTSQEKAKPIVVTPKSSSSMVTQQTTKTPVIVKPMTPKTFTPGAQNKKPTPVKGLSKTSRLNTPVKKKFTPRAASSKTPMSATGKSAQKGKISQSPLCGEKPTKRTRNSFEKSTMPSEPSPRSVSRRSTFSVEKVKKGKKPSISPDVKDLVCSMDTNKTNEEMKKNLINALDKKVQQKVPTGDKKEKLTSSTQIPRFAAFLEKKKQEQNKPITPGNKDWTKIHQKEFEKFDSIDVYLEKKRKHREDSSMSVKKARLLVEQTKEAINRLKNHKTPAKENKVVPKISKSGHLMKSPGIKSTKEAFKPTVLTTKQMNLNFSQTGKSPRNSGTTFKPSVLSTDKINLNFNAMKTPTNADTKTPKADPRKSTGSLQQRKSFATPFKFSAPLNNTIDFGRSAKKPSFDLKASLSRPTTWKTHKGKLKNMNATYVANNSAKSVKVQSREERRTSTMNKRTDQKFNSQMSRRGVVP